jgi:hypothetical protein
MRKSVPVTGQTVRREPDFEHMTDEDAANFNLAVSSYRGAVSKAEGAVKYLTGTTRRHNRQIPSLSRSQLLAKARELKTAAEEIEAAAAEMPIAS